VLSEGMSNGKDTVGTKRGEAFPEGSED